MKKIGLMISTLTFTASSTVLLNPAVSQQSSNDIQVEIIPSKSPVDIDKLPPPEETDFDRMRKNCKNVDSENIVSEPADDSSEECKIVFKKLADRFRNSSHCKKREPSFTAETQEIINRNCNRFKRKK
jgi:hypothetical protein